MDGLQNILSKSVIYGYPYFRKPTDETTDEDLQDHIGIYQYFSNILPS